MGLAGRRLETSAAPLQGLWTVCHLAGAWDNRAGSGLGTKCCRYKVADAFSHGDWGANRGLWRMRGPPRAAAAGLKLAVAPVAAARGRWLPTAAFVG